MVSNALLNPDTLTICPYPFTAYPLADNYSLVDCNQTYAQVYGISYVGPQYVTLIIAWGSVVLFTYRLLLVYQMSGPKQFPKLTITWFLFYSCLCSLCIGVDMIDWLGFSNIIPCAFYTVLDRGAVGCMVIITTLLVNFWKKANKMDKRRTSMNKLLLYGIILSGWIFSFAMEIVAVILRQSYKIISGLSYLFLSLIVIYLLIDSSISARHIVATLYAGTQMRRGSFEANLALNRKSLRRLVKKIMAFFVVGFLGATYLLAVAITYLSSGYFGYAWTSPFQAPISYGFVIGRVFVCLIIVSFLYMFRVPRALGLGGRGSVTYNDQIGRNTVAKMSSKMNNDVNPSHMAHRRTSNTEMETGMPSEERKHGSKVMDSVMPRSPSDAKTSEG